MVENLKRIVNNIENKYGGVSLFIIMKMDDITDKWSLLLTASWINDSNTSEVFDFVRKELVANLSSEDLLNIARIGIFKQDEHLVQLLMTSIEKEKIEIDGVSRLIEKQVNGNLIHDAYVIAFKKIISLRK